MAIPFHPSPWPPIHLLPRLLHPLISSPYSLVRLVQVGNRSVVAATAYVSDGVEAPSFPLLLARSVPHLHQVNWRILGEKGSSLIGFGSSIVGGVFRFSSRNHEKAIIIMIKFGSLWSKLCRLDLATWQALNIEGNSFNCQGTVNLEEKCAQWQMTRITKE